AEGYIAAFENLGHVSGYPDGMFHPDKLLTNAEFVTIINNIVTVTNDNTIDNIYVLNRGRGNISDHWAYSDILLAIFYDDSEHYRAGVEYEQRYGDQTGIPSPSINNITTEVIDAERRIYRLTITDDDFICGGTPFFWWYTFDGGTFSDISRDNRSVTVSPRLTPPFINNDAITITVGVGDGLGRIATRRLTLQKF
ncbi:MAG: S-layer homology domain-containing protein, partial [Clostridiales bacterium]|nr:S-layer homology domain-containing protein [Clostridiales bacterium]